MADKIMSFTSDGVSVLHRAVRGILAQHPSLGYDSENKVVFAKNSNTTDKVSLISGGGSGHEPAHLGYVGNGMLDAAVCGAVFASPNAVQIEAGLRRVASPAGTLVIVKNYTGDRLNFALAMERARLTSGTPLRLVVVDDDVSIGRKRSARVGRRGLAGTVLVHKVAGAAAAAGLGIDEVEAAANFVVGNVATIGAGLDACSLPGRPRADRLGHDEMEIGIGIHNEPGSKRVSPRPSLSKLISDLLAAILDPTDEDRNYLEGNRPVTESHDVVLLVNNLGATSVLDLAAITGETTCQLKSDYGLCPVRVYAGTFLSALNGPGFSITLLSLPRREPLSSKVLEWLDSPTDALGWTSSVSTTAWDSKGAGKAPDKVVSSIPQAVTEVLGSEIPCDAALLSAIIKAINESLLKHEPEITRNDDILGNGDCGTTLVSGAAALVAGLEDGTIDTSSLTRGFMTVAGIVSRSMGGTSGAIYAVFLTSLASATSRLLPQEEIADVSMLAGALHSALESLLKVTAARVGDRTMMDALIPFVQTLLEGSREPIDALPLLDRAIEAAAKGRDGTRHIESKFGRSTYVAAGEADGSGNDGAGIPDPGACGVVAIVEGIRAGLAAREAARVD